MRILFPFLIISITFTSCNSTQAPPAKHLTKEEMIAVNIDSLKRSAKSCDLIVREGDDMISEQIRHLNENDRTYSHAGLIIEKEGKKYVCHIAPGIAPADTIQFISIDEFIDPAANTKCALYRFDLTDLEKDSVVKIIDEYKRKDVRFDRSYDINTYDKMYCTEMIYHAFRKATNNRVEPKLAHLPKQMYKVLLKYFKEQKITQDDVAKRMIVTVDNVYMMPGTKLVTAFPVKYFPGQ